MQKVIIENKGRKLFAKIVDGQRELTMPEVGLKHLDGLHESELPRLVEHLQQEFGGYVIRTPYGGTAPRVFTLYRGDTPPSDDYLGSMIDLFDRVGWTVHYSDEWPYVVRVHAPMMDSDDIRPDALIMRAYCNTCGLVRAYTTTNTHDPIEQCPNCGAYPETEQVAVISGVRVIKDNIVYNFA